MTNVGIENKEARRFERRAKKNILLVGTNPERTDLLAKICERVGLTFFHSDSVDRLELDVEFGIVYCELSISDFETLTKKFSNSKRNPIFILGLENPNARTIVKALRLGAFDCIAIQETSPSEITETLMHMKENWELDLLQDDLETERFNKIQGDLDWNSFRKDLIRKDLQTKSAYLISNIRTSLSQGSGFGALVSAIGLLKKKAKLNGKYYEVPSTLIELLFSNAETANRIIEIFNEMDYFIHNPQIKEVYSISQIHSLFKKEISKVLELARSKRLSIKICEDKYRDSRAEVGIHAESFKKALEELLLNAIKFSEPNTTIYVLFTLKKRKLLISVLNSPKNEAGIPKGIPSEESEFVFQPFARLTKYVHEDIPTLDYGLGLPLVEKIVSNHEGKISTFNVTSFLDEEEETMVLMEMDLPILVGH
ncbi:sensor histidine kinase [Leptospira sarikeiensis]|uniref:ATP-binding protein n=1 Tax=Leptospira sarikeiensis TaxID=2484943 RepID=A0A4R9K9S6_9LEPT|nr:ATP-binding protein [Leptospira sarikeiensis]TGL61504.1 ATP-binding protein [Leptospira sarikeiensis]